MALIKCPECGREISDQAPACIHCGYPLPPKQPEPDLLPPDEPNRFSVVLTSPPHYPENRKRTVLDLVEELGISKADAMDLLDSAEQKPVVLRSEMSVESARAFANTLQRAGAHVKVVDGSRPCDPEPHAAPPARSLTFGETVWAVILGNLFLALVAFVLSVFLSLL